MVFFGKTFTAGLLLLSTLAMADDKFELQDFSRTDEIYMEKAYELAQEIARDVSHSRFKGNKTEDLLLLQRIVSSHKLKRDQRRELQALGLVLARTLADDLKLGWIIYKDEIARSRALRIDNTSRVVFPITSIARRYEVGAPVDINKIYEKIEKIVARTRENAPLYSN